jgi:hypothetical protein
LYTFNYGYIALMHSRDILKHAMQKWRRTAWITSLFTTLIFAVFVWGLQYKLSLYDSPHSITHEMPEAKLLSNQERAGDAARETELPRIAAGLPWPLGLFLTFSACLAPALRSGAPQRSLTGDFSAAPLPGIRIASLTPFLFRPPPAFR